MRLRRPETLRMNERNDEAEIMIRTEGERVSKTCFYWFLLQVNKMKTAGCLQETRPSFESLKLEQITSNIYPFSMLLLGLFLAQQ